MHYRTFTGPTVQSALKSVQDALGPSALVLSSRMVPAPGLRRLVGTKWVELTAAADRERMSDERQAASAGRLVSVARGIAAKLQASGLSAVFAESIAQHPMLASRVAGAKGMRLAVADALTHLVAASDALAPVEVFIGPPGVGKTTTIAKIAAQSRAARTARHGLLAADGFRVGAVEQLRLYADIIGSPFAVARSGNDLTRALETLRRPVLVDTAGRSPRDAGHSDILDALNREPGVRRHLVLPATAAPSQARRILERFAPCRPDRLVLTRLDEVETLAPLVDVLAASRLPVSYLAHGQSVPDDLQEATPQALTEWVLGDRVEGACA